MNTETITLEDMAKLCKIKELEADLYDTIPFKRSQAHVHGDDQTWIDEWEKEIEEELERIR